MIFPAARVAQRAGTSPRTQALLLACATLLLQPDWSHANLDEASGDFAVATFSAASDQLGCVRPGAFSAGCDAPRAENLAVLRRVLAASGPPSRPAPPPKSRRTPHVQPRVSSSEIARCSEILHKPCTACSPVTRLCIEVCSRSALAAAGTDGRRQPACRGAFPLEPSSAPLPAASPSFGTPLPGEAPLPPIVQYPPPAPPPLPPSPLPSPFPSSLPPPIDAEPLPQRLPASPVQALPVQQPAPRLSPSPSWRQHLHQWRARLQLCRSNLPQVSLVYSRAMASMVMLVSRSCKRLQGPQSQTLAVRRA